MMDATTSAFGQIGPTTEIRWSAIWPLIVEDRVDNSNAVLHGHVAPVRCCTVFCNLAVSLECLELVSRSEQGGFDCISESLLKHLGRSPPSNTPPMSRKANSKTSGH